MTDRNLEPKVKITIEKAFEMLNCLKDADWWDWNGDPSCRDGYTVLGKDEECDLTLREYNPFFGTASVPLADGIRGEWVMPLEKANDLASRIAILDRHYFPQFNPRVVKVVGLKPVE